MVSLLCLRPLSPLLTASVRNANLSHITTGYVYNSPSQGFVRVDEAYDGHLASSYFDFSNVTKEGLVDNTLTMYDHESTTPTVWRGYVNSNYPIFQEDILVEAGAVFEGLVKRDFIPSPVAAVRIPLFKSVQVEDISANIWHSGASCIRE